VGKLLALKLGSSLVGPSGEGANPGGDDFLAAGVLLAPSGGGSAHLGRYLGLQASASRGRCRRPVAQAPRTAKEARFLALLALACALQAPDGALSALLNQVSVGYFAPARCMVSGENPESIPAQSWR